MYVYVDREIEAGDGDITKCVTRRLNGTLRIGIHPGNSLKLGFRLHRILFVKGQINPPGTKCTHLVTTLKYRRWLRRILFVKMEINRPGIGGREKEIVGAR